MGLVTAPRSFRELRCFSIAMQRYGSFLKPPNFVQTFFFTFFDHTQKQNDNILKNNPINNMCKKVNANSFFRPHPFLCKFRMEINT